MMAYQEWIKRGRDPIDAEDFRALSCVEVQSLLARVIEITPHRIEQLRLLITERRPKLDWRPDYTEEAFRIAAEVLSESVEIVPRDPTEREADLERQRRDQPEILHLLGESVRDWEATDRSFSIAFDVALYFAQDLISKEERLVWQIETRKNADWNQPILRAPNPTRRPPFLSCPPFAIFRNSIGRIAGKSYYKFNAMELYREWMKDVAWYRAENP